jgi:hypothetical protein
VRNIRDDYAWFFAAADHYVAESGLIAFVVSDSFCYATSYRFFREDLLRHYHIRHLINLGASVFRDVGPRTQFVIIIMERRAGQLRRADDCDAIPYLDLRPLAGQVPHPQLGTEHDPRLQALAIGSLPEATAHTPARDRAFGLFPANDVVARVNALPVTLHGNSPRRVFIKKWPGLITAFDELFKSSARDELTQKIRAFFDAVGQPESVREELLDRLAFPTGATSEKNRNRLSLVAQQAAKAGLTFEEGRVRRAVSGAAPRDAAWYPDERQTVWVYYEPRLRVPRNVNEGRDPGWGTMSQWRDESSHLIDPKFVFTSSTNVNYGLKAFIVPGDWLVKLHGGESQQFNYAGLNNPGSQVGLDGPNNLGSEALVLWSNLTARGHSEDALLYYLAGIYNSRVAEEYLRGGGFSTMRIPLDAERLDGDLVDELIDTSRRLRNLHWLAVESRSGAVAASLAESLVQSEMLQQLGFDEHAGTGGRFVQRRRWQPSEQSQELIQVEIRDLRETLDVQVGDLYPRA